MLSDCIHTLLLVEDEPVARHVLKRLLTAQGYRVEASGSGEEALEHLTQDGLAHTAVIDFELPGMNGAELLHRLEKHNPNVFTVVMSARSHATVCEAGVSEDVPFLQKPLEFSKLLQTLARHRH